MKLPGALALTLLLAACQTTTPGTGTTGSADPCVAFRPITFSIRFDSAETVEQIVIHNAAWDAICMEQRR